MKQHMIEHRTERVVGIGAARGLLDRFRDGDAQRALVVGIPPRIERPVWVLSVGLANTSAPKSAS